MNFDYMTNSQIAALIIGLVFSVIAVGTTFLSIKYAKRFDNLVYGVQVGRIRGKNINRQITVLCELVENLKKLGTIPQVNEKKELIMML